MSQRGSGVGGILRGIYKFAMPRIKKHGKDIAKTIGKEAMKAGVSIAGDVATRGVPMGDSMRQRARESGRNLRRKVDEKVDAFLSGSGYKVPRNQMIQQLNENPDPTYISRATGKRSPVTRKKKKKSAKSGRKVEKKKATKRTARDIFSG